MLTLEVRNCDGGLNCKNLLPLMCKTAYNLGGSWLCLGTGVRAVSIVCSKGL